MKNEKSYVIISVWGETYHFDAYSKKAVMDDWINHFGFEKDDIKTFRCNG